MLLSTGSLFHLPLKTIAAIGRCAGFAGLELILSAPGIATHPDLGSVDRILPIRSLHAPFRRWADWGGHLASWRATTALANSLDHADHVTMHPPGTRLANMIQNRWFEKAHDLPLLLDAKGKIRFSLENMPWPEGSPFARDPLERLLRRCRDKNVGLTFDVCHMGVSGRDVLKTVESVPVEMLYNVHFSDARGYTEHMAPGTGDLPLDDFLHSLGRRGYAGYITLELEPNVFPDSRRALIDMLINIRENMEKILSISHKES